MDLIDKSKKLHNKILKVSYQLSIRQYQWRKKIIFVLSNKWENLKNVLFYWQQIAYTNGIYHALLNLQFRNYPYDRHDVRKCQVSTINKRSFRTKQTIFIVSNLGHRTSLS